MLTLLKLYSVGPQTPSPVGNMEKPEYRMGDTGEEGSLAIQASENALPSILGGNFVVNIYLLPRREAATHPYPSSIPGAQIGNCFLKQNTRGTDTKNNGNYEPVACKKETPNTVS